MEKSLKSKVSAVALIGILILSAVLGLFLSTPAGKVKAEEEINGLRFKQVSLGADFGIGLSYDSKLYGWDIGVENGKTNSLGISYGVNPKLISVRLVKGASYNSTSKVISVSQDADPTDKITKIATTLHAAAFITQNGNVYTWGANEYNGTNKDYGMLLRKCLPNQTAATDPVPALVDYANISGAQALVKLFPAADASVLPNDTNQLLDIQGGENNFVIKHYRSGNGSYTHYFGWGATRYLASPGEGFSGSAGGADDKMTCGLYSLKSSQTDSSLMAIGGNTLMIAKGTSLFVRGKNYYIPDSPSHVYNTAETNTLLYGGDSGSYNVLNLNKVANITPTGSENTSGTYTYTVPSYKIAFEDKGDYYANEAIATRRATASNDEFYAMNGSAMPELSTADLFNASESGAVFTGDSALPVSTFSLGNGYGYYIKGGELFFFGNGYNGQSGLNEAKAYDAVTNIPKSNFDGKTPVAVAAGKTLSGKDLLSNIPDGTINSSADKTVGFTLSGNSATFTNMEQFADGNVFLSGLIGNDGSVYVWNKDNRFTDITDKFEALGINGGNNKIVALYSAYGNHLYALSNLGKLYHISYNSMFDVSLIDHFATSGGNVINWTSEDANRLDFALSNGRASGASESQKTFLSATLSLGGITKTDDNLLASSSVYNNVIKSNPIGDAHRILTKEDTDLSSRAIISDKLVSDTTKTVSDNGAVKFYFKDNMSAPIDEKVLTHYLDYTVNKSQDISITIRPYQSTGDKVIVMQYYVARYDTAANFTASQNADFKFYDYDLVSLEITIANTAAQYKHFDERLSGADSNLSIPVLDPNNSKNNIYSIALSNVQFGINNLASYYGLSGNALNKFNAGFIDLAYAADEGFPASQRIDDAYLSSYFFNGGKADFSASSYYNDQYQFIAFDVDGDKLSLDSANYIAASKDVFFATVSKEITVKIPLKITDAYDLSAAITADTIQYFNNIYNMTLSLGEGGDSGSLVIKYNVVQLQAKKSSNMLFYEDNDIRKPLTNADINTIPRYDVTIGETYFDITQNRIVTSYNNAEQPILLPAYVQANMIMTKQESGEHYRAMSDLNKYQLPSVSTVVGDKNTSKRVFTFDLLSSGLFKDYSNIFMTFKLDGENGPTYNNYGNNGFLGQYDSEREIVSLDKHFLRVEPKVSESYSIEIELRRFTSENMTQIIKSGEEEAEIMTLKFLISGSDSAFETNNLKIVPAKTVGEKTEMSVSEISEEIDVRFLNCKSSDPSILKVELDGVKGKIIMTPLSSGNVEINFTVGQYAYSKKGSFNVNVESRSVLNKPISLISTEKIALTRLKGAIAEDYVGKDGDDDFNYSLYSLDKDFDYAPEGFYFVKYEKNPETEAYQWNRIAQPQFIGSVRIVINKESKAEDAIEFSIGKYDNFADFDNIMFVAKFAGDNKKFEAAVRIAPSKKFLLGEDKSALNIVVDTKAEVGVGDSGDPVLNSDGQFLIPMKFLTDKVGLSSGDFSVNLVTAVEAAYDYFNISNDGNTIIIAPIKSTDKMQEVNVRISSNNEQYVLTFFVSVTGIIEVLPKSTYVTLWLACAAGVFVMLFVIFVVRMGIYWKKKAEQKRIIKKNQMLIKMRDKVHNKTEAISKEQIVQTKLKMEDPKYAKMFNEMKRTTEERTGITLENSTVARKAEAKTKALEKTKKKKNGKKSIEELKAELSAKKEALVKMQMGEVPVSDAAYASAGYSDGMSREDIENQINEKLNSDDNILFDVETLDDDK